MSGGEMDTVRYTRAAAEKERRINHDKRRIACRVVKAHSRTSAEEKEFLAMLGLDIQEEA